MHRDGERAMMHVRELIARLGEKIPSFLLVICISSEMRSWDDKLNLCVRHVDCVVTFRDV